MARSTVPTSLSAYLERNLQQGPQATVHCAVPLWEKAFGVFLVLSGGVSLQLAEDNRLDRHYGPGACSACLRL